MLNIFESICNQFIPMSYMFYLKKNPCMCMISKQLDRLMKFSSDNNFYNALLCKIL